MLAALANPLLVREVRQGLPDVVALVIDRSQSMRVGARAEQAEETLAKVREILERAAREIDELGRVKPSGG